MSCPTAFRRLVRWLSFLVLASALPAAFAQTLINIDFGVGELSAKAGFAGTGQWTNDHWNLYRHYEPRFLPGMPLVAHGRLDRLRYAHRAESEVWITVSNAPGVWGNASGDPMWDTYLYAANGSNIVATIGNLEAGRYHFLAYGHADADVSGEQNSFFTLLVGTNRFGPLTSNGAGGWRATTPMQEGVHFVVFRDVPVSSGQPVTLDVAPGPNGVAVLNGLQILSRGTSPPRITTVAEIRPPAFTNLLFQEVHYEAALFDHEARFRVRLQVESLGTNEVSGPLFEGDLAVFAPELPDGWRIERRDRKLTLVAAQTPGSHTLELEILPRLSREEPWSRVEFIGPPAAVATLSAQATGADVGVELMSGTPLTSSAKPTGSANGVLSADRKVALRWQTKAGEVTRQALVTATTAVSVQVTPAIIRYLARIDYAILQAPMTEARVALPAGQTLTRIDGTQVRDWRIGEEQGESILTVEFLKPVEGSASLTLTTEQMLPELPGSVTLTPARPLAVQRESGALRIAADDMRIRVEDGGGFAQINAQAGDVAAFRFFSRPASVRLMVERLQPEIKVTSKVAARLEEARFAVRHHLDVTVSRAGIYSLEIAGADGFVATDVKAPGLEGWKREEGRLRLQFTQRVLGGLPIEIELEQALPQVPDRLQVAPLRVAGAGQENAQVSAVAVPGFRLRTATLEGAREIPTSGTDEEMLAYRGDQAAWRIELGVERLAARVVAEVFNLLTIGDGYAGGSATVRYGILNQGVQQFRLRLPAHWRNVDFTGPNIRRKDQQGDVWTIGLQDKAWGGYTLVITYDHPFDPAGATLDVRGAHPLDVERESGYLAVTTAASLKIEPATVGDPLRVVDAYELPEADRALVNRPILLAYRYSGTDFTLNLRLTRHDEMAVLDAVADRSQLTTVLTDAGEMLTQAGFMVKNNDRQFQRFRLPPGAELWGVYVNGEPVKGERDGEWLMVSLPRNLNRDEAFAVDIKYAEKLGRLRSVFPQRLRLTAPGTDVPTTYAEWEIFVPESRRLWGFGGSMIPVRGTTYGFRDAWDEFVRVYRGLWLNYGGMLIVIGGLIAFTAALWIASRRKGFFGLTQVLVVFAILAILASMLLPALSKAKSKAVTIRSVNQLKHLASAARIWSHDNGDRMPPSLDELVKVMGSESAVINPETGVRYEYLGAGRTESEPNAILAFGATGDGRYYVAMVDGSVQILNGVQFQQALLRSGGGPGAPGLSPELAQRYGLAAATPPMSAPAPAPVAGIPGPGQPTASSLSPSTASTTVGLRSIRVEIPRTGRRFQFTKVLNVGSEPLTVAMSLMRSRVYTGARMVFEVSAFLAGLGLIAWQWRKEQPRALPMAVGAGLALVSTISLFLAWRALHLVLVFGLPVFVFLVIGNLVTLWLRKRRARALPPRMQETPPPAAAGATAIVGMILAGLFLLGSQPSARAAAAAGPSDPFTLISAEYSGEVRDEVAHLDATLVLAAAATNRQVTLFGPDVAIQSIEVLEGNARVWREGTNVGVLLPGTGASLRLSLVVRPGGDVSRRLLSFRLPPALASRFNLRLDTPDAEVEFPTAVAFKSVTESGHTLVEAVLGTQDRVELAWTPRVRRSAADSTVFVQQNAHVRLGGGAINVRSTLAYQVAQGELRDLRIQLPAAYRLLRLEGDNLRTWDVSADGTEVRVELAKVVSGTYSLVLEAERLLETLPASFRVELPRALDVRRESGILGISTAEEVTITIDRSDGTQRIDAAEFARATRVAPTGIVSSYRYARPDFELFVRAEPVRPEIEAVVRHAFTVEEADSVLAVQVDYDIRKLGVFQLRLALPNGFDVESVECAAMRQWTETSTAAARVLEVELQERTLGKISLQAHLRQRRGQLPPTLAIAGAHPLAVNKMVSTVAVGADAGIGIKTSTLTGLVEIPVGALGTGLLPQGGALLAFKVLAPDPTDALPWTLTVSTEAIESWVRAEVAHVATVTEALVSGRTVLRYEIQNAPRREFRFRTPSTWRNVEIQGEGIRRRDQTTTNWTVELQSKVRGSYELTLLWEEPRGNATNNWQLSGFSVEGVERETGYIAVAARSPMQITPRPIGAEYARADTADLPAWARANRASDGALLVWRYLRPGGEFSVAVQRFTDAAVLQALVESVRLVTVVADDGQWMTEMRLGIRNNGRQYLELTLPAGATVWSAFVAGKPVRPQQQGGRLLLPLEGTDDPDAPVGVELTYVAAGRFPRTRGHVELASPALDLPLKDARWDLFLPPDYEYEKFGGSMNYTLSELAPLAQDFTLAEYRRQEEAKEEEAVEQLRRVVSRARSKLAAGQLGDVKGELGSLRRRSSRDETTEREVQQIEEQLNRVQGSNLLQAQNQYVFDNASRLESQQGLPAAQAAGIDSRQQYLEEVAQRQVVVLQKAQTVATAQVQPLRVNLPTRGLRHSFTQVLQTEVGKPLTVEFKATNQRRSTLLSRLTLWAGGFISLWALCGVAILFRKP